MGKTKHGMRHHRVYNTWNHMLSRCNNKKDPAYQTYGQRGVKVCEEWYNFVNFWTDMKSGYQDNLTLDRIDPNGDYSKANCRWLSIEAQQRNRTNNLYVEYDGQQILLKELCEQHSVNYQMVWLRLFRYNWSIDKALFTKSRMKKYG